MSIKNYVSRFNSYAKSAQEEYGISKIELIVSFAMSYLQCRASILDFFVEEMYLKNRRGRREFATHLGMNDWYRKHNDKEQASWLRDKEEALIKFEKYTKRDWCGYRFHSDKKDYEAFSNKHDRCIVKPLNDSCGRGIHVVETLNPLGGGYTLYDYCHTNNVYPEELIEQHSVMSSLHQNSINTVRIVTVAGKCVASALRMGCGGSVMDNAVSGGLFALVDIETGIVTTMGMNYENLRVVKHPDSGVIIPGFSIPYWKESKKLVEDAAHVVNKLRIIGWDIAITPNGPTLVEANDEPGMPLLQVPARKGIRRQLTE